jgi:hypothetical protein
MRLNKTQQMQQINEQHDIEKLKHENSNNHCKWDTSKTHPQTMGHHNLSYSLNFIHRDIRMNKQNST